MHAQYQQHKPCILGVEIKKPRSQPHMPRHASFILLSSQNPSFWSKLKNRAASRKCHATRRSSYKPATLSVAWRGGLHDNALVKLLPHMQVHACRAGYTHAPRSKTLNRRSPDPLRAGTDGRPRR
jgi:hypothetical protein